MALRLSVVVHIRTEAFEAIPRTTFLNGRRSSKVDWPTLYLKARSRRPLLKCAEVLPLVVSPSRRAVGSAKVSKELKRKRLPGVRPFTVEANISETVAFARAAWRRRVQSTDVCFDEKAWLSLFPGCEGTKV